MFIIGADVNERHTSQVRPLGALALVKETNAPDRIYMYIQATAAFSAGAVVLISGGTETAGYQGTLASTTSSAPGTGQGKMVGVVVDAFAINEYGWVLVFGSAQITALASCAAHTQLNTTGTGGALDDDATAGSEVIDGIVLRAANGGSTANVNAIVCWPKVGRTL